MSFLEDLMNEIDSEKTSKKAMKSSPTSKLYDFEKTVREMAKAQGLQPRNFLIKIAEQNPRIAQNKIIQKLIGEQDVPTQKGRDAKPEVLTKRAMNVVKKGIKHSANKQRRRMDKDSVGEDVKDQFTKLINPMGQDSRSLEKIKQSPGFHDMISTMFASGTQADMEWDEIFSAMSKLLNMNPIEIKAILQQDGMDFSEPDAAERFSQNLGATGFLGKGKTRTVNSVYEDADDLQSAYDKVYAYTDKLGDRALEKIDRYAPNFSQAMDQHGEIENIVANSNKKELHTYMKELELVRYSLELDAGGINEDAEQDAEYAKMIIQQNPQEYRKFMQTGDLMDAPTIYEKLFAYFSSSDADDMMPYGTQKARDGDPYVWLTDKLDDLGLTEGNEFAQKVRQLKATGAKKGTKFKTSDGEEHTLEGDLNAWYAEQYARELAEKDGKVWAKMPYGDKEDYRKIANKKYGVVKSEAVSDKKVDSFHTELDRLVHKYFGHSPDEKREKQKMKEDELPQPEKIKGTASVQQIVNLFPEVDDKTQFMQAVMKLKQGQPVSALPQVRSLAQAFKQMIGMNPQETQNAMNLFKRIQTEEQDQGEVQVGSYQTKHFDICPSATKLYKDIDVEDMDLAERSAKLHDTLFYMEKHAQEMKEADPEYIEMMQNLADQIMAMAGMMGLESEHEYVQGHVDAVKNMKESVTESVAITEEEFDEQAGEKDACYHKVKSRYKVWPSAYASGALVKCRKVGASNWGNKSK